MTEPVAEERTPLTFKVAPHIVQDLGLNLYTTLPRVLVEFVANAHDADAKNVRITCNIDQIKTERSHMKKVFDADRSRQDVDEKAGKPKQPLVPLARRTLPGEITIVIEDNGHGMSREDLGTKYLIAGRRRREEEGKATSANGRPLMGRKGLGKLAGFGVAQRVVIESRKAGEKHATRVSLDYEELVKQRDELRIVVPDEELPDGGGLPESGGTRVTLSRLVYEASGSASQSIKNSIGDHFPFIRPEELAVELNGEAVAPIKRDFEFAWPEEDELGIDDLVSKEVDPPEGDKISFKYRIRFTKRGEHLTAGERGVRVYAHNRLASAPSLLGLPTGIHGFKNTEYLDGVVEADFVDDDTSVDYIATDRQSLRWEVPLLHTLRQFLTSEMKAAIYEYQKRRDKENEKKTRQDAFTKEVIADANLPSHRVKFLYRVASLLASEHEVESKEYREQLEIFVTGVGQGDLLGALATLANSESPELQAVVSRIAELTMREHAEVMQYVHGRIDGIEALRRFVRTQDFRASDNEADFHQLLGRAPWLLNVNYRDYIASNQTETAVLTQLEGLLEIGSAVSPDYDPTTEDETAEFGSNKRPDLVFLLQSAPSRHIVIVELKSPNTPLHMLHLTQLLEYMGMARAWAKEKYAGQDYRIEGILIGSRNPQSKSRKVTALNEYLVTKGPDLTVLDIVSLLDQSEAAHRELLEIAEQLSDGDVDEDEEGDLPEGDLPKEVKRVMPARAAPPPSAAPAPTVPSARPARRPSRG